MSKIFQLYLHLGPVYVISAYALYHVIPMFCKCCSEYRSPLNQIIVFINHAYLVVYLMVYLVAYPVLAQQISFNLFAVEKY